jgi:hypothetical protein
LLDLVYLEMKISCMVFWEFKILHKRNYFYRLCKKCRSNYFYDKFSSCRGLVKETIRWDEFNWLKSIDNNLKTLPVNFWRLSSFRQNDKNPIEREIKESRLT